MNSSKPIGRRTVLRSGLAAAIGAALPLRVRQTYAGDWLRLEHRSGTASFFGDGGPRTGVWCYNDSVPGPMHLPGHSFRLLSRNGKPVFGRPWLDTVLLAADDRVEVSLVADNPGDWLFRCHVLEHMQAGMSAVVRVA